MSKRMSAVNKENYETWARHDGRNETIAIFWKEVPVQQMNEISNSISNP